MNILVTKNAIMLLAILAQEHFGSRHSEAQGCGIRVRVFVFIMASPLIMDLHGTLLRELAEAAGEHFLGLGQAARHFRSLPLRLRRKLHHLDITYNLVRHMTQPGSDAFLSEIRKAVAQPKDTVPEGHPPATRAWAPIVKNTFIHVVTSAGTVARRSSSAPPACDSVPASPPGLPHVGYLSPPRSSALTDACTSPITPPTERSAATTQSEGMPGHTVSHCVAMDADDESDYENSYFAIASSADRPAESDVVPETTSESGELEVTAMSVVCESGTLASTVPDQRCVSESQVASLIDLHLGYAGESWGPAVLRDRAKYLLTAGRTPEMVEVLLTTQGSRIASLRQGSTIQRIDGPSWSLVGNRGQRLDTMLDTVQVISVDCNGEWATVQDPKVFGRTDLKQVLFSIVHAPG